MPIQTPKLIYASSERCADILYATGFFAPDEFLFLQKGNKKTAVFNQLEIDRAREEINPDIKIIALEELVKLTKKKFPKTKKIRMSQVIFYLLEQNKISTISVPSNFPALLAFDLQKLGISIKPCRGLFFPEREFKTAKEISAIKHALKITELGIKRAYEILKSAKINSENFIIWSGKKLTSEILRAEIESTLIAHDFSPSNTIVAGGRQACNPYSRGTGALKANELIIIDVFPRDNKTGYFGDLTRTCLKGKASQTQKKLWHTVLQAQETAIKNIKPKVKGNKLQKDCQDFFKQNGYPTKVEDGVNVGFFHGLGHGIGLELHEEPRLSQISLKVGQVFTVEPGLYYPKIGGVRHEDVVLVTDSGCEILSSLEKVLEF